jgi:hypothetical protein
MDRERINAELNNMTEWKYKVIFSHQGEIIASSFDCNPAELQPYLNAFESRDATIGPGFVLNGEHYDVHRFHPPLIYGRRGGPDEGSGIALCRAIAETGNPVFALITYDLPILSARAVP